MKKVLLSLGVAVLMAGAANAQVSYGLKAGVNLGKITNLGSEEENNTSFHVTGYADLPVAPNFSIQPGLSLQGKGSKYVGNWEGIGASVEQSANIMSLEVPVNAVLYIPTGVAGSVFLGAGPYVGFNVSGRNKVTGSIGDFQGSSTRDLSFSGDDKDLNLIDAGVNFLGGYRLSNGFLLNAGYGLGLTNLNPNSNGNTWNNRVLSFGLGFQF